jgi:hypothetical protein
MNTVTLSTAVPVSSATMPLSSTTKRASSASQIAHQPSGDTAIFSGHAMLLSRLFHTNDTDAQPPVQTTFTTKDLSGFAASFLKMDDRKLVERAYEYASTNGMDLEQVDAFAIHLSDYRFLQVTGDNTGEIMETFDAEGNPFVGKFNAHDAGVAKRILTSQAINDTDIDKGFLSYMLNPQKPGGANPRRGITFESFEKLIFVLSPSNGQTAPNVKTAESMQPTDARLAQALYRIDHPYEGEKQPPVKPRDAGDQPRQHLNRHEIRQLLAAYQMTLLQGTSADAQSLAHLTDLAGLAKGLQNGHLNGNIASPQDAIDHLRRISEALSQAAVKAEKSKAAQGLATYNKVSNGSIL